MINLIDVIVTFVIVYIIAYLMRDKNEKGVAFTDAVIVTIFVLGMESLIK